MKIFLLKVIKDFKLINIYSQLIRPVYKTSIFFLEHISPFFCVMIYSPYLLSTFPLSSCPPWLIVSIYHPSSVSLSAFHCLSLLALKSITDTLAFGEGEEYRWSCIDQEAKTHKCSFMHMCTLSCNRYFSFGDDKVQSSDPAIRLMP